MPTLRNLHDLTDNMEKGARVLVRADLNVPLDEAGAVRDATRLARLLPTLNVLMQAGARIGILSHFGRPKKEGYDAALSLKPVVSALAGLLNAPVAFAGDCAGEAAQDAMEALPEGGVCVLENTRFHKGEMENDAAFSQALAQSGDAYVNDAFSVAHRAHASTEGITHYLPAYCGLAMQAELDALAQALTNPKRPLVALVGGAKISSKISILENLSQRVDVLIIGGAMANTFLAAQNIGIGKSFHESDMLDVARRILKTAPCEILLPHDVVVAAALAVGQKTRTLPSSQVPNDAMILDAGAESTAAICARFDTAATLIWNGPLGAFETAPFDAATNAAAQHAAARCKMGALTAVAGGGDTIAALAQAGVVDDFSYISTAGGAFLEWLEGKTLPAVAALSEKI